MAAGAGFRAVVVQFVTFILLASTSVVAMGGGPGPVAAQEGGDAAPEIVGGTVADVNEFPFMVSIRHRASSQDPYEQWCGGTLISPTRVLTAAHCFDDVQSRSEFVAVLGTNQPASGGTRIGLRAIRVHPGYQPFTAPTGVKNDLAVVELDTPAPQAPVTPIGPAEGSLWSPGTSATVVGWGRTATNGAASANLLKASVPIQSDSTCQARWSHASWVYRPSQMLCAGSATATVGPCNGDSGGPLLVRQGAAWRQVGIVSGFVGRGCGLPTAVSIFTQVPTYASAGDRFTNAVRLPSAGGVVGDRTYTATRESGEPNHAGNRGGSSIWYRWTAPTNGPVKITTAGSSLNTLLAVYRGTSVSALTPVASNDNINGTNQSRVQFTATSGIDYRIAIDGYNGSFGNTTLTLTQASTTPTDPRQFLAAFLATWWSGDRAGLTAYATPQALTSFTTPTTAWISYRLNWDQARCDLGHSGRGSCYFTLFSAGGGGWEYEALYRETDPAGHLIIDGLRSIGGGA